MMMKSVFWWRKPEYPEETTDLRQVTDETFHTDGLCPVRGLDSGRSGVKQSELRLLFTENSYGCKTFLSLSQGPWGWGSIVRGNVKVICLHNLKILLPPPSLIIPQGRKLT